MTSSKVGFFGGTFDPIHFGHLNLALHILEIYKLDRIFFSPANFSPEKEDALPSAPNWARREMVDLATKEIPKFTVIDNEMEREGPSYTIDTIRLLQQHRPHDQFYLILGEDILQGLPKWKEVEALLELAPPLVGCRPGSADYHFPPQIQEKIREGMVPIPMMEISSTVIRERLIQKKYCGHLVPAKVLDYIQENRLY